MSLKYHPWRVNVRIAHKQYFHSVLCVIVGIFLLSTGCDRSALQIVSVNGVVTLDGVPLEDATIIFKPEAESGRDASGSTDQAGKFLLLTPGAERNGCFLGDYKVVFLKTVPIGPGGKPLTEKEMANLESCPESKSVIPEKYTDAQTSGFQIQVLPKRNLPFVFDLSSK